MGNIPEKTWACPTAQLRKGHVEGHRLMKDFRDGIGTG